MSARTDTLLHLVVNSIAAEYIQYTKWATRRACLHVVPLRDFCNKRCETLDIPYTAVEDAVKTLEAKPSGRQG